MEIFKKSGLLKANPEINPENIPSKYKQIKYVVKYDLIIESNEDFYNTLESLRYHMIDDIPFAVYEWFIEHPDIDLSNYKDIGYGYDDFNYIKSIIDKYTDNCDENGKLKFSFDFSSKKTIKNNYDIIKFYKFDRVGIVESLSLTKFLVEKLCVRFSNEVLEYIVEKDDKKKSLEILKYLFSKGYELYGTNYCEDEYYSTSWSVCDKALLLNNKHYLKFALDNECQIEDISKIYKNDRVEMLIFLKDYGYDLSWFYEKSRRKYGWRRDTFMWKHQIESLSCRCSIKCIKYLLENNYISYVDIMTELEKVEKEYDKLTSGDDRYGKKLNQIKETKKSIEDFNENTLNL